MFIVQLTYKKPLEEIDRFIPQHIEFLDKYYSLNKFICSGRRNPRTGGVILVHNTTELELNEIITEDPFWLHQLADYEIIEFIPTKFAEGFRME